MASIIKSRKGYRAYICVNGARTTKQFRTKAEAKSWAFEKEEELRLASDAGLPVEPELYFPVDQPIPKATKVESIELLARSEIIAASRSMIEQICGVYFLLQDEEIVYVGQSTDFYARLLTHSKSLTFNRFSIIECPKSRLDDVELLYIQQFSPKFNKKGKPSVPATGGLAWPA